MDVAVKRSKRRSLRVSNASRFQEPVFTVGAGVMPSTKLVNVQQFKKVSKYISELSKKIYFDEFVAKVKLNSELDCNDLVYTPPMKVIIDNIEKCIENERWSENSIVEFMKNAPVLDICQLNAVEYSSNLNSIKQLRDINESGQLRTLRKMVNYAPKRHRPDTTTEMSKENSISDSSLQDKDIYGKSNRVNQDDVLVTVVLFIPETRIKAQEYLFLSSQCLSQLRDRVHCVKNISNQNAIDKQSNFFFIENCFYIDADSNVEEHCAYRIKKWMESEISDYWSQFSMQIKFMQNTKFDDLNFSIEKPYLYFHNNNCEHLMSIKNVRNILDDDETDQLSYPILTFQNKIKLPTCQVCEKYCANFTTINDLFALQEPFYYCERCYRLAHFDQNMQPLGLKHKIISNN